MTGSGDTIRPLEGRPDDYDELIERIGDARFVLIGEASHGTHEFYRERAEITRRLIVEKHFNALAAEADWPDAYRVNRYVRGTGADRTARDALGGFQRFPAWMWRNEVVLDFVAWLRAHNGSLLPGAAPVGFYGLDLYSLFTSIAAVLGYLDKVDPEAARRARFRYGCFDHYAEDTQAYGYAAAFGMNRSCEDSVVRQLQELQARAFQYASHDGEAFFEAEQNARLVKNAQEYYRRMFKGRVSSWNLRDGHMAETLDALARHLDRQCPPARIVVWAHNSHLGDARATEMGESGELNLGQLARERFGHHKTVLVGFSTYDGTVTAADDWGEPARMVRVRPALPGSYEALFHELGLARFIAFLHRPSDLPREWRSRRLQRAIGVIYRPGTERMSHYFNSRLTEQFDVMIHFDRTRALRPLEPIAEEIAQEVPETYPTGK
jgi:erythromycin esterase-like protein